MLRPTLVAIICILALAVGQSEQRCFITNDWRDGAIVPGEPDVLVWQNGPTTQDVLLNIVNGSSTIFVGAIARNVSQGSVFWIPPWDVYGNNSEQLFTVQLWDLTSQNGCSSPAFKFAKINRDEPEPTSAVFYGPFVTTALSILDTGYVTVTATVATYSSDDPQFLGVVTGSITATDSMILSGTVTSSARATATATSTSTSTASPDPNNDDQDGGSGPNKLAIIIGTIGGALVLALVVLSILLWRARRKRAGARARADSTVDLKDISPSSTPDSHTRETDINPSPAPATELSEDTARHEMMGSTTAPQELPSENMEPVELPADEIPPPSYPHWEQEVSPTTGDSRRSSLSFDKGTFTVSPLSDRRDRKE
ncbi:hypothetical protein NLU13_7815 [Sarocladium strictum]|uniref:Mid2 domain-containing protein n=1 Tax=Sarocladium strictum TaxID=5046 RepID=A0AA39L665_SARSR|nr:hypothetical protein NLU13_7815 [Sarocladium strictum]